MMKNLLLTLFLCVAIAFASLAQTTLSKQVFLGSDASGKWYKLAELDASGSTYNSAVVDVEVHYVNTWNKYKIEGLIRMRKSADGLFADWQYTMQGGSGKLIKLVNTGSNVLELYLYSNGTWAHASTKIHSVEENASALTINLMTPESPGFIVVAPDTYPEVGALREYFYPESALMIGTDKVEYGYKLAVKGKIKAEEIKVTATEWADFVFADNYALPPLEEVGRFIKERKHLPGIPSEAEVLENGIELGAMNARLLQKIEELTLYMIEQHEASEEQGKRLKEQSEEIERLKEENQSLKSLAEKLLELEEKILKMEVRSSN